MSNEVGVKGSPKQMKAYLCCFLLALWCRITIATTTKMTARGKSTPTTMEKSTKKSTRTPLRPRSSSHSSLSLSFHPSFHPSFLHSTPPPFPPSFLPSLPSFLYLSLSPFLFSSCFQKGSDHVAQAALKLASNSHVTELQWNAIAYGLTILFASNFI